MGYLSSINLCIIQTVLVSESFNLHLQYKQRQVSIYSEVTEASAGLASCSPAHTAGSTIVVAEANSSHTHHHQLRQTSRESVLKLLKANSNGIFMNIMS